MRTGDLRVGMEVAVKSSQYDIGDRYGPFKGVVLALDVHVQSADVKQRTFTQVRVENRDGTTYGDYYLDGKNIISPWSDVSEEMQKEIEHQAYLNKRSEIERQMREERIARLRTSSNRIYALLAVLGITSEMRESRYSPGINLGENDNLGLLERILADEAKRKGQKLVEEG